MSNFIYFQENYKIIILKLKNPLRKQQTESQQKMDGFAQLNSYSHGIIDKHNPLNFKIIIFIPKH